MDPAIWSALITGGAGIFGNGMNAWSQGESNRVSTQFAREAAQGRFRNHGQERADMYRDWIRTYGPTTWSDDPDRLAQWMFETREGYERDDFRRADARYMTRLREQREYDSPEALKNRFIAAGMNPALIYGGSSGSVSAPVPSTSMGSAPQRERPQTPQSPRIDPWRFDPTPIMRAVESYFNVKMMQHREDQMESQSELAKSQADLAKVSALEAKSRIPVNVAKKAQVETDTRQKQHGKIGWLLGDKLAEKVAGLVDKFLSVKVPPYKTDKVPLPHIMKGVH